MNLTINIGGRLVATARPLVMGIVNVTPDSFFAASRTADRDMVLRRTEQLIADGALSPKVSKRCARSPERCLYQSTRSGPMWPVRP